MSQPQQPKAAPTNNQNSLDELADWILHEPSYTKAEMKDKIQAAINKTIMEEVLAIVGDDEPETELKPFSDGNGNVGTVLGQNVARNTLRAELRQQITKKYGRADNE